MEGCTHDRTSLKGMRRVGLVNDDESVLFACPECGFQMTTRRCIATRVRTEGRCEGSAIAAPGYCWRHVRILAETVGPADV